MFIQALVFIKDNTRIFKHSNALYGLPIDSDRDLIYISKFLWSPLVPTDSASALVLLGRETATFSLRLQELNQLTTVKY